MNSVEKRDKEKLIKILEALIKVIVEMRKTDKDFLLGQNEREARDWLHYLESYNTIDELAALKKEVVERLVDKFDVQIGESELDDERVYLMRNFIYAAGEILQK